MIYRHETIAQCHRSVRHHGVSLLYDLYVFAPPSVIFLSTTLSTVLGILRMNQSPILELGSIEEIGPSLSRLFMVDSDTLFQHIEAISISDKKFKQLLKQ